MEAGNSAEAAQPGQAGQAKARTPPYIAYKTLNTFLSELKNNGMPPQIDRSVLTRFAGGLQGQIMLALRSLDLIDTDNRPKPKLKSLVDAYDTAEFKSAFRPIIEATYPYVMKLDLMTATPTMFADAFKENTDAKEEVLRKCRRFFLHAAKDVGIPLGTRIEKATFPRNRSNGKRTAKPVKTKAEEQVESGGSGAGSNDGGAPKTVEAKALEYQLIDLMTQPDIDDNVKQSIWALVQYLTARKAKKGSGVY